MPSTMLCGKPAGNETIGLWAPSLILGLDGFYSFCIVAELTDTPTPTGRDEVAAYAESCHRGVRINACVAASFTYPCTTSAFAS